MHPLINNNTTTQFPEPPRPVSGLPTSKFGVMEQKRSLINTSDLIRLSHHTTPKRKCLIATSTNHEIFHQSRVPLFDLNHPRDGYGDGYCGIHNFLPQWARLCLNFRSPELRAGSGLGMCEEGYKYRF